ncbi:unnamed protein product [Effrenium voratum]|uniref:Sushi domain-containing protein n=1 Tax=Effrenium voratum TaxID=2562239 RepID=A0AA36N9W6_9DINO|nr:unnamed protein product [Effrenium voratum]CAJ1437830.1 unnamed protein product [Effrenium voratum]
MDFRMWLGWGWLGFLPFGAADTWWTSSARYTYLKMSGSYDDKVCNECIIEFDGNLIVAGATGPDGITYDINLFDGFLAKITEPITAPSTWNWQDMTRNDWKVETSAGSYRQSEFTGMSKTSSEIIVVGFTFGDMEDFGTNLGPPSSFHTSREYSDAVIMAYNTAGALQWGRQVGTNTDDKFTAVSVNPYNEIYAAGTTWGDVTGGPLGGDDIIIYRFSSSGSDINKYQLGTASNDYVSSLWHHGSILYLGGKTEGSYGSHSNAGDWDLLLIKFSSDVQETWSVQRGSTAADDCQALHVHSNSGEAYVVGNTKGSIDGQTYSGGFDVYIMKFDYDGNWMWTRQHGGSRDEYVHGVYATESRLMMAGTTDWVEGFDGTSLLGYNDAFVVEYTHEKGSSNPTWVSTQFIGSDRIDEGKGFVERSNGDIYLVGGTEFDPQDDNPYGELDVFVQLLTTTTSTQTSTSITETTVSSTSQTQTSSTATSVTVTTSTITATTSTSSSRTSSSTTSSTATSTTTTSVTTTTSSSSTQTQTSSTSSTQTNTTSTQTTSTATTYTTTSTTASSSSSTTATTSSSTISVSTTSSTSTSSTSRTTTSTTATSSSSVSTTSSTQSSSATTTSSSSSTSTSTTSSTQSSSSSTSTSTTSSTQSSSTTTSASSTSTTLSSTITSTTLSSTMTSTTLSSTMTSATLSSTMTSSTWSSTLTSTLSSTSTTTSSTATSLTVNPNSPTDGLTTTAPPVVPCSGGLPSGPGVVAGDCSGKVSGETCSVTCDTGFEGGPAPYSCTFSGIFTGPALSCSPATCPTTSLPEGLDISDCSSTALESFCFVRCPTGFVTAESVFTCLANGSFSGVAPTCEPIQCSPDSLPADSSLNVTSCVGTTAGNSCQVGCKFGYDGPAKTYTCPDSGTFQGTVPSCARKECSVPSSLSTSAFTTDCAGKLHGQTCMATCTAGHSGAPSEYLCDNGLLIGQTPSCEALPCQLTGIYIGLGVNTSGCDGATTGSLCSLQCAFGYQGVGNPTMTCQSDGTFLQGSPTFQCEATVCGNLSDSATFSSPEFADTCQEKSFGQTCSVSCRTGWDLQGDATMMLCYDSSSAPGYVEADTLAASSGPTCVARVCTAGLPSLRGADHDCSGKTTLQNCTVQAALGFTAVGGSTTLQCATDGEFKGSLPSIEAATCPTPSLGAGVGSTCENKTIGAECWAYCVAGYAGSPQPYTCVANSTLGVVRVEPVQQEILCSSARRLTSSNAGCGTAAVETVGLQLAEFEHSCSSMAHADVCISHCSLGWALTGNASVMLCQDGVLDGNIPQCDPVPCIYNLPNAIGVQHNCSGVATGGTCVAVCAAEGFSYAFGGAETFECLPTGEFQGQSPSCVPAACQDITLAPRFEHRCLNMVYGDSCSVACAEGFSLMGSVAQYQCMGAGQIEGMEPVCLPKQCTNTVPATLDSNCDGVTTGSNCTVSCAPGMVPNSAQLTCHAMGTLIGLLPSCVPEVCSLDASLETLSLANNCQDVPFGRTCSVFCAEGYKLTSGTSGEVWTCALTGSELALVGTLPSCEPLTCPIDLVSSRALQDNCTDLPVGSACTQTCSQGFAAASPENSSATFTCMVDLSINAGQRPQCLAVECNSTTSIPNVEHTCMGITAESTCYAFCRQGFTSTAGVVQWTCAGPGSTEPVVDGDLPAVDGYALKGVVPACVPEVCNYNFPVGDEYVHNCQNISTDDTCEVNCSFGWFGNTTTLSCAPNGVLSGDLPSCSPGTLVRLSGFLDLQLSQGRRLQGAASSFASDVAAQEAVAAALAGVLDVEVAVQLSLFMGDSVRAEYTVSQAWSSADLARSWAQTVQSSVQSTSLEQVKDAINEELAGTGFQVDSISAFEVSISVADGVPQVLSVEEDQPVIVPVIIVLGSLAIFALMCCGAAFYCRMKDRKHVETRSEAEGGIRFEEIVVAEDPEANETRQAAVAPAESLAADPDQNQMDLDNQGVPSESTARLEELMMENGVSFLDDDRFSF